MSLAFAVVNHRYLVTSLCAMSVLFFLLHSPGEILWVSCPVRINKPKLITGSMAIQESTKKCRLTIDQNVLANVFYPLIYGQLITSETCLVFLEWSWRIFSWDEAQSRAWMADKSLHFFPICVGRPTTNVFRKGGAPAY